MTPTSSTSIVASRGSLGAAGLVFAAGLLLYVRTTGYEFLNWDDGVYVVDNPWIQGLSAEGITAIFSRGILGGWLPVHLLSYLFDHAIWGLDPFGYHLHSVLLNALNGALAFFVLARLTGRREVAFAAALLFAVHPSHVSSVTWISARKELLFTAFALLSTAAYLEARRGSTLRRGPYLLSLALFALGMLSKVTISTLPGFLLLLDAVLDRRRPPEARSPLAQHLATKLPFLALAMGLVWVNVQTQVVAPDAGQYDAFVHLLVKGQAAWRYALVLLGIQPGQPLYDAPPISTQPGIAALTLAPLVLGALAIVVAWWRGRQQVALALAWLGLGLLPALAFPLVTFMADRYLYAPSLGFCWLLALGIVFLADRAQGAPRARMAVMVGLTGAGVLWFAPTAWSYTPVWRTSETLWTRALETSRDPRAAVGLSELMIRERRLGEARELLLAWPDPGPKGFFNLMAIDLLLGRPAEALAWGDALLASRTHELTAQEIGQAHALRARAHLALGQEEEARDAFRAALGADPDNPDAWVWLRARMSAP